jgi:hypothetical protein
MKPHGIQAPHGAIYCMGNPSERMLVAHMEIKKETPAEKMPHLMTKYAGSRKHKRDHPSR